MLNFCLNGRKTVSFLFKYANGGVLCLQGISNAFAAMGLAKSSAVEITGARKGSGFYFGSVPDSSLIWR
jgi:hypothetical protein